MNPLSFTFNLTYCNPFPALCGCAKVRKSFRTAKTNENQIGVLSFNIKDVHPHDTATILSSCGVCVRAGDHCAQPLIRFLNLPATCRASMYIHNTKADIDRLIMALNRANDMFKRWRSVKK